MNYNNIEVLRNYIGKEWIHNQIEKTNDNSLLKELGSEYETYHPFVHYQYELDYLIRLAETDKAKDVALQKWYHILNNAGWLLKMNLPFLENVEEMRMRLRDSEHFDDVVWELEVATMLRINNVRTKLLTPNEKQTNDLEIILFNKTLQIECKNKELNNSRYNTNQIFAQSLINSLSDVEVIQGKAIEISYENARYQDIRKITKIVRDKFDIFDYQSIDGRYKVRSSLKYFEKDISNILDNDEIRFISDAKSVQKKDLYKKETKGDFKCRFILKFPLENKRLSNLENLLKKANKQLIIGGVLFLKVPHETFDEAKEYVQSELNRKFSNISAIKLFGIKYDNLPDEGIRVDRKEELITSSRSKYQLSEEETDFFRKDMFFSKYNLNNTADNTTSEQRSIGK